MEQSPPPPLDLDQPVYRIFQLGRFDEMLRSKQLALVRPHKWEDPFEQLPERCAITDRSQVPWKQTFLQEFLKPAFGQCWSRTRESDTLWRAYSRVSRHPETNRNVHPDEEGVQVVSTSRKLREALGRWASDPPSSCFIDAVQYAPEVQIKQDIANRVGQMREQAFSDAASRAHLLFLKRPAFQHEAEVRLVYVEQREVEPIPEVVLVPIDPSAVFDAVIFDPRLEAFERLERQESAKSCGYQGPFPESGLYRGQLLEIIVGEPPPEHPKNT